MYHGGDTGDAGHFEHITQAHTIDIALMPIAPYTMRELQQKAHIDQKEAIDAFKRLNARVLVPMHCCTLPYCHDDAQECIEKLHEEWRKVMIDTEKQVLMFKFGKQYILRKLLYAAYEVDTGMPSNTQ